MLTLFLLRHAKSSWSESGLGDLERPLAPRGTKAAPQIARYMAEQDYRPAIIFCSPATRARQTLDLILATLQYQPEIHYDDELYDFVGESGPMSVIKERGGGAASLMLVGHNPSLEILARNLIASGPPEQIDDMRQKYPTGALAIIKFSIKSWSDLKHNSGQLVSFVKPRALG